MAAELVETSRLFARTVAAVDPAWAEELAGDLAKRSLSEPHWSKTAGAASAYEKVTLFGVEIIPRRRVQLSRFDRPLARELFLRHALVEGEWDAAALDKRLAAFERRNLELRRRLEKIEERERRRDILAGDEAVFRFYDTRIPRDVFDVRSFEAWWRDASSRTPRLLDMTEADLAGDVQRSDERDFPARWRQGDQVLSLAYRFEPGAPDDGVTAVVPLALLAQLRPDGFDWQVPGMRDELIAGLIRSLPKAIRRHVVPAADWAARFAEELDGQGPESHDGLPPATLRGALAARIQRIASQPVSEADFDLERVPGHLQVSFRAVDERGRAVGSSRDLADLQEQLAGRARASVSRSLTERPARAPSRTACRSPSATPAVAVRRADGRHRLDVRRPARGRRHEGRGRRRARVSRRSSTRPRASRSGSRRPPRPRPARHAPGVRRLALLAVPSPAAYVLDHLTSAEKLALAASPYPSAKALIEDARVAVADAVIARTAPDGVQTRAAFEAVRDAFSAAVVDEVFQTVSLAARILTASRDVERAAPRSELADPPRRPERREDPARGARPPRIRRAHGRGAARAPPPVPARRARPRPRARRQPRPGPAADDGVRAGSGALRRCGRGDPRARRGPGPARARPLAARGVPREPVRPVPRHRRAGLAPAAAEDAPRAADARASQHVTGRNLDPRLQRRALSVTVRNRREDG